MTGIPGSDGVLMILMPWNDLSDFIAAAGKHGLRSFATQFYFPSNIPGEH